MRRLLYASALLGLLPLLSACEADLNKEAEDVNQAHRDAAQNVAKEQEDIRTAAREGAENVIKERQDAEDAAIEGNKKILDEQRELEAAERAKAEADRKKAETPPSP